MIRTSVAWPLGSLTGDVGECGCYSSWRALWSNQSRRKLFADALESEGIDHAIGGALALA